MASYDTTIAPDACGIIGNTPMVYLRKVTEGCHAQIAVKLEYLNPACSVKDRIGYQMVQEAEDSGRVRLQGN